MLRTCVYTRVTMPCKYLCLLYMCACHMRATCTCELWVICTVLLAYYPLYIHIAEVCCHCDSGTLMVISCSKMHTLLHWLAYSVSARVKLWFRWNMVITVSIPGKLNRWLLTGLIEEHLQNLTGTSQIAKAGNELKWVKCAFLQSTLEYLGYQIDANGVRNAPSQYSKLQCHQSRAFLGLLSIMENLFLICPQWFIH